MGLEAATFIDNLVTTNPVTGDDVSQGDDHIRLIKAVLKQTLPNADRAYRLPKGESVTNSTTITEEYEQRFVFASSGGDTHVMTLPTLASNKHGWYVVFVKTSDAGIVRPTPASGTINGAASFDLTAEYSWAICVWTGGTWFALLDPGSVTSNQISDSTALGRALLTAATDSAARLLLDLGALAELSAINDAHWVGTPLAVGHGGTGGTTQATARSGLGLGDMATRDLNDLIYTGSSNDNVSFPVGEYLLVDSTAHQRNIATTIRLDTSDANRYKTSGAGDALAGMWRARGSMSVNAGEHFSAMFRRTA